MTTRRIFFLSCAELDPAERSERDPLLIRDDEPLVEALLTRNITVSPVDWEAVPPSDLAGEGVVVRSPWNYTQNAHAFAAWIREAETAGVRLVNPASLILGTLEKTYLMELADAGLDAIPTRAIDPFAPRSLGPAFDVFGTDAVILKPVIGAGARHTHRIDGLCHDVPDGIRQTLPRDQAYLVQPFVPEIATQGELSVMFFGGRFGHMVRKRPALGDFRVQEDHGGRTELMTPDEGIADQAARASRHFGDPAYIRVDGVPVDDRFQIMELEMIEPELFFRLAPASAALFAERLQTILF